MPNSEGTGYLSTVGSNLTPARLIARPELSIAHQFGLIVLVPANALQKITLGEIYASGVRGLLISLRLSLEPLDHERGPIYSPNVGPVI